MSTKMNKLNKEQLTTILNTNYSRVEDSDLQSCIAYTAQKYNADNTKVTKKDLLDLVKSVVTSLGEKFVMPEFTPVVAEHSLKKKPAEKSETTDNADKPADKPEPKKPAKKSAPKKSNKKSANNENAIDTIPAFPADITAGDETYTLATDIKNMDDLYTALENGEEILFAFYWTKKLLKQFPYFNLPGETAPESFPDDLDLATCIFVSEERRLSITVSLYTEAPYTILPDDITEYDNVRYSAGCEYQIYRKK